ncbi:MAG: L-histidine N(alpha)-methyltransferase [Gemmatimonadota bacterium]|nr:MAG: L-histidine N(alpha)-methyltransferase [Gemmatimonadota bacterium]
MKTQLAVLERSQSDPVLEFAQDAVAGLTDSPRWLPCRYLYDERGSQLFEQICDQPEYYQTQAEAAILERRGGDIRATTGPVTLIELGSGTSVKTDFLLAAYTVNGESIRYVPIDVSESALQVAAERIARLRPTVRVAGIVGTYESAFPLFRGHSPVMVVFLGSTIGNLNVTESAQFFTDLSDSLEPGDFFLLGVDLVKDADVIEAAYNDRAGVTAQFTTNIFARMNRELGSAVDLDQIRHVAVYNSDWQRMEVFIEFLADQEVKIGPLEKSLTVAAGERVMIEISRKFVIEDLQEHVEHFGFTVRNTYFDDDRRFGLLLMQSAGA